MAEEKKAEAEKPAEEAPKPADGEVPSEAAAPAPKKKKKKKKKKKPVDTGPKKPPLMARLVEGLVAFGKGTREIAVTVLASDWRSRRMAILFFLSLIGTGATLVASVQWMLSRFHPSHSQMEAERLKAEAALILKQKVDEDKKVGFQLNIGKYLVELQTEVDPKSPNYGVVDMAEIEIVVECEEDETCAYLKSNNERMRDQVTKILVSLTKEELLSLEGKTRLKEVIKRNLMSWVGHGKIRKVFFIKVLMG